MASDDGGAHFSRHLVLVPGVAGYSSLACGFAEVNAKDSDCAALYKAHDGVRLVRFSSSAITADGA